MSMTNIPASGAVSESLPASHLKLPPPSTPAQCLFIGSHLQGNNRMKSTGMLPILFYPRVMALKKHPYNLHVTHPTSGHILVNLASLGHYDTNDDGIGIEV